MVLGLAFLLDLGWGFKAFSPSQANSRASDCCVRPTAQRSAASRACKTSKTRMIIARGLPAATLDAIVVQCLR